MSSTKKTNKSKKNSKTEEAPAAVAEAQLAVEPIITTEVVAESALTTEATAEVVTVTPASIALQAPAAKSKNHRARPNVVYTLAAVPPADSVAPQEHQICLALHVAKHGADLPIDFTEQEAFDAMLRAAASGVLKTKQDPIRILTYYRKPLGELGLLLVNPVRAVVKTEDPAVATIPESEDVAEVAEVDEAASVEREQEQMAA
jgi:hypothetical protein